MTQDTLTAAKERFTDAQEAFRDQRNRMIEDLRFSNPSDPQQWDDRARSIRENGPDGARPCLTLDHTNQYVAQTVNDSRQNKPAMSFMPVSGGARVEVAEALDGIARHIEYQSRAQIAYDTGVEHSARVGLGWWRVVPEVVNESLNYQEIRIKRVHDPLAVLCDPDWAEPDGADIQYGFVTTQLTKAAFKRKYPKAAADTWSTKDIAQGWAAGETLRLCEYFEKVSKSEEKLKVVLPNGTKRLVTEDDYWQVAKEIGTQPMLDGDVSSARVKVKYDKVMWRTMSGVEVLEETEFPSCHIPLVPVIGYELWIEGKRYLCGMVRRMMEAQRAYNYERSAWVETVALQPKAPFLAAAEAVEGHEAEWSRANRANQAYLPWNAYDEEGRQLPKPDRSSPPTIPAAFAQGAQFADMDIQASVGMYRESLGQQSNAKSGKAILARQREGDTANFHYIDNLSRSIERTGRIVLDMITRLYDEPREARILGQDGSTKAVRIDPKGDAYSVDGEETSINPSTGTYDVRVKAGPSYTTLRQEASEGLNQMMQGNPQMAAVVGPVWASMQDWPMADKLSKALLSMAPAPVQQALGDESQAEDANKLKQQLQQLEQQAEQMHQMLQMAGQKIQELQSEDKKTTLDGLAKSAALEIDEYKAQTERMKVMAAAIPPEQVAQLAAQLVMQSLQREPLQGGEELENSTQEMAGLEDEEPYGGPMGAPPGIHEEPGEHPEPQEQPDQPPTGGFSLPAQPAE